MTPPDSDRRAFLKSMGASAAVLSMSENAAAGKSSCPSRDVPVTAIVWQERQDGRRSFFLDPLAGERSLPNEPLFGNCLGPLVWGRGKYRFASGRTECLPSHPLVVGGCYDFAWTYFPEDQALPIGAVVAFSIPRSWTQPRIKGPGAGLISVSRSGGDKFDVRLTHNANMSWWIVVTVTGKAEQADGWIRVDVREMSVQRFPQDWFGNWRNSMRTAVDTAGKGQYAFVRATKTDKPVVRSAPSARFHVAAPAVAKPGETITAVPTGFRCLGRWTKMAGISSSVSPAAPGAPCGQSNTGSGWPAVADPNWPTAMRSTAAPSTLATRRGRVM